jgi:hypothetical protein
MRAVIGLFLTALLVPSAVFAAPPQRKIEFTSPETVLAWINTYRHRPDPARVSVAVKALSAYGAFRDPETSGVYVGFLAGALGSQPDKARETLEAMFPLPVEDHWVVVRSIAYSGLPGWKDLLREMSPRMPARQAMIDRFIEGKLPTLLDLAPAKEITLWDRLKNGVTIQKVKPPSANWALDASAELLDIHWGYYFATGAYGPILRIVAMLPWSIDKDHVEKLTIGQMAKYTLAKNSTRDAQLVVMLRRAYKHQDKDTASVLKEVIEAADTVDTGRIRKDALAAIEDLKRKGPGSRRDALTWGKVGEGAIALGCIGAAVAGQVALGLPCVVGGAVTSAALRGLSP